MKCHDVSCSAGTHPPPPTSSEVRLSPSCMSFVHRVSFRLHRRRLPGGASLFRAYRMCARARVSAGAVRAPDCARARKRRAHFSRPFRWGFFRTGARRETKRPPDAASSCFILSWFCEGQAHFRYYFKFSMNKLPSPVTDPILPFAKRFHPDGLIPAGRGLTPGAEPDERRPPCAISGRRHRNMS